MVIKTAKQLLWKYKKTSQNKMPFANVRFHLVTPNYYGDSTHCTRDRLSCHETKLGYQI